MFDAFATGFEAELEKLMQGVGGNYTLPAQRIAQRIAAYIEQAMRHADDPVFVDRMRTAMTLEVSRLETLAGHGAVDVREFVDSAARQAVSVLVSGLIGLA